MRRWGHGAGVGRTDEHRDWFIVLSLRSTIKVSGSLETAADGVTCIASLATRLTASCRRSSLQSSDDLSHGKNSFPSAAVLLHSSPIAGSRRSRLKWCSLMSSYRIFGATEIGLVPAPFMRSSPSRASAVDYQPGLCNTERDRPACR